MENFLRERVRERLEATGLNPFEAARRIGNERTFLNDLLIGRKETIRQAAIPRVAAVLDCDPEYLLGAQATPRRTRASPAEAIQPRPATGEAPQQAVGLPLAGICEVGAWRTGADAIPPRRLPVAPDTRLPVEDQVAFLVRGTHADALGLADGDVVVALMGGAWRDGDVLVVRRARADGTAETFLARAENRPQDTEVVARAIFAHRVF